MKKRGERKTGEKRETKREGRAGRANGWNMKVANY